MTETFEFNELVIHFLNDEVDTNIDRVNDWLDDIDFIIIYDDIAKGNWSQFSILNGCWESFVQQTFNNFYHWLTKEKGKNIDEVISSSHLLYNLDKTVKWFKECCDVDLDITKGQEHVINSIAYYTVCNCPYFKGHFAFEFKNRLDDVKRLREYSGESKYTCVICLENKLIYTGCSCCISALVCAGCYPKLGNVCPICRCDQMIKCIYCRHLIRTGDTFEVIEGFDVWAVNFNDVGRAIRGECT